MDIYDIRFSDKKGSTDKGFNIRDKEKAIRMAQDILDGRKGLANEFVGGTIAVYCKKTGTIIWQQPIQ